MMISRIVFAVWGRRCCLLLAPLVLAGCLTTPTIEPIRYFTISPAFDLEPGAPTDKTLGIRPLSNAQPYKEEMAYTARQNRIAYFHRAEWAEAPATMVNRALTDGLRALGLFKDVGNAADMARPDFVLTGEMRRFDADYTGDVPEAVVELSLAIRPAGGETPLWKGLVRAAVPLPPAATPPERAMNDTDLAGVAESMSVAVADLVTEIANGVRQATGPRG